MITSFSYRPALDGLRAIAVLAVILYHVHEPWLPGGYLGVDLFFVLSGFLITSLLVIEHDKTGTIRLRNFWSRRARRLLPAVLVLIVAVAVVEHQTVQEVAIRASRRHELLATLFYVANWFFIATGGSYFAGYAGASPVRHTWSLAIEEQFYVLFPFFMAGGLKIRRRWLMIVMTALMVASALLMAGLFNPTDPTRAYYGTDARIHQLLAGGILALVLAGRYRSIVIRWARRLLPLSAVLMVWAFFAIQDDGAFYYRGGAFLVGLIAVGLIAGLEAPAGLQRVLSVRPLVGIGKISYGMYLWHFPIVVWLVRLRSPSPGVLLVATLALTLAVSIASYFVIERPIRVERRLFRLELTPKALAAVVPAASIAVAGFVFVALPDTLPEWAQETAANSGLVVREATPSPTSVEGSNTEETKETEQDEGTTDTTVAAERPGSIAIVGDSFMASAYPGFRTAASESGITLVEAAFPACPVGYEPIANLDGSLHYKAETCLELTTSAYGALRDQPADVVLWHDLQSVLPRFDDNGEVLIPGTPEWQESLIQEWLVVLDEFLEEGMAVVVIKPPLRSQEADCTAVVGEQRCTDIQTQDETIRAVTDAFALAAQDRDGVTFMTVDEMLCPAGVPCPATVEGITVREGGADQTHFTEEGAVWFARNVFSQILEQPNV